MIFELRITDPQSTCVAHWPKAVGLRGVTSIPFTPGLNILWGPNGCGKTTAILSMARMLHCAQGGVPVVTNSSMRSVFRGFMDPVMLDGAVPIHDGQAVVHVDPSRSIGTSGGSFDDDFFKQGLLRALSKGSAGETSGDETITALERADGTWPEVAWKVPTSHERAVAVAKILSGIPGEGPLGPKTLLLDEPDRSLAFHVQVGLWEGIAQRVAKGGLQVIAVTHSPAALWLPDANYIEFVPGHLEACKKAFSRVWSRSEVLLA